MEISVTEVKARLDAGEQFIFIDVREPWESEEFSIGARLVPLNTLVQQLPEWADHKEDMIVLHCRSGSRSSMAQMVMKANGFKNVYNMTGGISAWQAAFGS